MLRLTTLGLALLVYGCDSGVTVDSVEQYADGADRGSYSVRTVTEDSHSSEQGLVSQPPRAASHEVECQECEQDAKCREIHECVDHQAHPAHGQHDRSLPKPTKRLVVYGPKVCDRTQEAREALKGWRARFEYVDTSEFEELPRELVELARKVGSSTSPIVTLDGEPLMLGTDPRANATLLKKAARVSRVRRGSPPRGA